MKTTAALKASEKLAAGAAGEAALIVTKGTPETLWTTISSAFGGGLIKLNQSLKIRGKT
jgi:hypothetical protein